MLNLLQSIFRSSPGPSGPGEDLIRAAIERVIDGTEPRLRAASHYRKRLREPVTRSVEHVIALVDSMPAPVEISRKRFATDPHLRAFFVSDDHLQEVVSYSEDLQKYIQTASTSPMGTIHCLLTLDRSQKGVLGMALRGNAVSHDVAQIVVNFSNHRLVGFAEDEAEMRWELKKRAFDHLIETALLNLTATRDQSQALAGQRRLLQRKLAAMQSGNWGMESLLKPASPAAAEPATIERQLAGIEAELAELETDTATLEGQLGNIAATLSEPEACLQLERISLTLDSMGVRLEGTAAAGRPTLELVELVSGERRRVMLPGYVFRAELLPPRDFIKEAQRRLQGGH